MSKLSRRKAARPLAGISTGPVIFISPSFAVSDMEMDNSIPQKRQTPREREEAIFQRQLEAALEASARSNGTEEEAEQLPLSTKRKAAKSTMDGFVGWDYDSGSNEEFHPSNTMEKEKKAVSNKPIKEPNDQGRTDLVACERAAMPEMQSEAEGQESVPPASKKIRKEKEMATKTSVKVSANVLDEGGTSLKSLNSYDSAGVQSGTGLVETGGLDCPLSEDTWPKSKSKTSFDHSISVDECHESIPPASKNAISDDSAAKLEEDVEPLLVAKNKSRRNIAKRVDYSEDSDEEEEDQMSNNHEESSDESDVPIKKSIKSNKVANTKKGERSSGNLKKSTKGGNLTGNTSSASGPKVGSSHHAVQSETGLVENVGLDCPLSDDTLLKSKSQTSCDHSISVYECHKSVPPARKNPISDDSASKLKWDDEPLLVPKNKSRRNIAKRVYYGENSDEEEEDQMSTNHEEYSDESDAPIKKSVKSKKVANTKTGERSSGNLKKSTKDGNLTGKTSSASEPKVGSSHHAEQSETGLVEYVGLDCPLSNDTLLKSNSQTSCDHSISVDECHESVPPASKNTISDDSASKLEGDVESLLVAKNKSRRKIAKSVDYGEDSDEEEEDQMSKNHEESSDESDVPIKKSIKSKKVANTAKKGERSSGNLKKSTKGSNLTGKTSSVSAPKVGLSQKGVESLVESNLLPAKTVGAKWVAPSFVKNSSAMETSSTSRLTGLRVGLSRNFKPKPLHTNVKWTA